MTKSRSFNIANSENVNDTHLYTGICCCDISDITHTTFLTNQIVISITPFIWWAPACCILKYSHVQY